MEKQLLETSYGTIASYTAGLPPSSSVPTLLLIHGNSSSSQIFRPIYTSPAFTSSVHILAFDLPGHGASGDAPDPVHVYHQPGYAAAAAHLLQHLRIHSVLVLGWSLGGHAAIELVPLLRGPDSTTKLLGIMIVGTPPSLGAAQTSSGFKSDSPHMHLASQEVLSPDEVDSFSKETCGPPFEEWMREAVARTDGRARKVMFEWFAGGVGVDQVGVVRDEKDALVAVVNGADEPFVNLDYIDELEFGNLWEGKAIRLEGLLHAPFWEAPKVFNPILERFVADCKKKL